MSREELRGAAAFAALLLGSWLIVLAGLGVLWWLGSQLCAAVVGLPW